VKQELKMGHGHGCDGEVEGGHSQGGTGACGDASCDDGHSHGNEDENEIEDKDGDDGSYVAYERVTRASDARRLLPSLRRAQQALADVHSVAARWLEGEDAASTERPGATGATRTMGVETLDTGASFDSDLGSRRLLSPRRLEVARQFRESRARLYAAGVAELERIASM